MKVIVEIELETEDYGGKEFYKEIKNLISDIDPHTKITRFHMRMKGPKSDIERDFLYESPTPSP